MEDEEGFECSKCHKQLHADDVLLELVTGTTDTFKVVCSACKSRNGRLFRLADNELDDPNVSDTDVDESESEEKEEQQKRHAKERKRFFEKHHMYCAKCRLRSEDCLVWCNTVEFPCEGMTTGDATCERCYDETSDDNRGGGGVLHAVAEIHPKQ